MARNILIGRRDFMRHDRVTISSTIDWPLSLDRIQNLNPQKTAEAVTNVDINATKFTIDLGFVRTISIFSFANFLTTRNGLFSLQAGTDNTFVDNEYDTGMLSTWPKDSTAFDYDTWGQFSFDGIINADDYAALNFFRVLVLPAAISCRYIQIQIVDPTNHDPVQIGCFSAFEAWEPDEKFAVGHGITVIDASQIDKVPFGSVQITDQGQFRRLNIGLPNTPSVDFILKEFSIGLTRKKSQPIIVIPFPDDTGSLEKRSVYGLFSQDNQYTNPYHALYANTFQVDELY